MIGGDIAARVHSYMTGMVSEGELLAVELEQGEFHKLPPHPGPLPRWGRGRRVLSFGASLHGDLAFHEEVVFERYVPLEVSPAQLSPQGGIGNLRDLLAGIGDQSPQLGEQRVGWFNKFVLLAYIPSCLRILPGTWSFSQFSQVSGSMPIIHYLISKRSSPIPRLGSPKQSGVTTVPGNREAKSSIHSSEKQGNLAVQSTFERVVRWEGRVYQS